MVLFHYHLARSWSKISFAILSSASETTPWLNNVREIDS